MTNKERLERLKKISDNVSLNGAMSTHLRLADLLFLIEHTDTALKCDATYDDLVREYDLLLNESKRYRKALEFYAKWKNYIHGADGESVIDIDGGHRANQILRGESYWREELEFETEVISNIYENPDLLSKEEIEDE